MSFITADQLLAHGVGDYILQSDWMAMNKTKDSLAAFIHALTYAFPFWFIAPYGYLAVATIIASHFLIDRFRLARYVCWFKNGQWFTPVSATGYAEDKPAWMAVWLFIIADNILHVAINGVALKWLT